LSFYGGPWGIKGLEVDTTKADVIQSLFYTKYVKAVRSSLGHVGFYRRFIKHFSKIASLYVLYLQKMLYYILMRTIAKLLTNWNWNWPPLQ